MRKIIFVFICVIISAVSVSAQEGTKPPVYKDIPDKSYSGFPMGFPGILELLNVEDEDIEKAIEIHREAAETIEIAKNKQAILKTKLKYDLMDPQVDMEEVEQLLRDTLELELKIQMAQIERDLEIRNLFGDDIWARRNIVNRSFFSNLNVDEKVKSFSEAWRIMKDYPPEVQKKFLEQLERVYIRKSEELIRLETVLNKLRLLMTKSIRS